MSFNIPSKKDIEITLKEASINADIRKNGIIEEVNLLNQNI